MGILGYHRYWEINPLTERNLMGNSSVGVYNYCSQLEVGCFFTFCFCSMRLQKDLERFAFILFMALSKTFGYKEDIEKKIHSFLYSLQPKYVREVNKQESAFSYTQNMAEQKRCIKYEQKEHSNSQAMFNRYSRGDIKLTRNHSSKELLFLRNNRYMHYGNTYCTCKTLYQEHVFFLKVT